MFSAKLVLAQGGLRAIAWQPQWGKKLTEKRPVTATVIKMSPKWPMSSPFFTTAIPQKTAAFCVCCRINRCTVRVTMV
jgi:hypothetical protein